jgi:hypothetical protein
LFPDNNVQDRSMRPKHPAGASILQSFVNTL